jgi:thioredoxin reductase (NADPH)
MNQMSADVAIVGAGPIGLELAVSLKRAGLSLLHFDSRQIGHTISWFAPQTRFFSSNDRIAIAGVPLQTADQSKASREEYLAYLRGVVEQFDLNVRTYEPVIDIKRDGSQFRITTSRAGQTGNYTAGKVVVCTGGTEWPRRLGVPGEDLPHVSHYFQDPHSYFRRRLLIVGGRNSAIEAAIRCHRAGSRVTLAYRRSKLDETSIKYWLMPEIALLIESGKIGGHFNSSPVEITPDQVVLRNEDGRTFSVPADSVLLLIGYEADMSLCKAAGVELVGLSGAPKCDPQTMETNIPGLYVAGTVVGGTQQRYKVFIENCHVHVSRITAAVTGAPAPAEPAPISQRPES